MCKKIIGYMSLILAATLLTGCSITIGGNVTGLTGSGLVLQNNDGDDLSITANGTFTFSTPLGNSGGPYAVTVKTQPSMSVCTVSKGTGTATASVSDIEVRCVPDGIASLQLLAGGFGEYGSSDGAGAAARFNNPYSVAVDGAGNAYVADTDNHTIRKISPAGAVTTLAGLAGSSGSADGTGAAARFNTPYGVAVDSAGNVYVADTDNHTIRKISPAGVVTTLAGLAGSYGSADGTGAAARFNTPPGVALDSAGNIYVADYGNHTIRKISPAGVVTTLAGLAGIPGNWNGIGALALFYRPTGIVVDSAGNVYVADTYNNAIRKISPVGRVTTLAGATTTWCGAPGSLPDTYCGYGNNDGTGSDAKFYEPRGIVVDGAGNLYVADSKNYTIRKISPTGVVSTVVGMAGQTGIQLGALPASLGPSTFGVAVSDGKLFVISDDSVLWAPKP